MVHCYFLVHADVVGLITVISELRHLLSGLTTLTDGRFGVVLSTVSMWLHVLFASHFLPFCHVNTVSGMFGVRGCLFVVNFGAIDALFCLPPVRLRLECRI
jgi:hypothetical protein